MERYWSLADNRNPKTYQAMPLSHNPLTMCILRALNGVTLGLGSNNRLQGGRGLSDTFSQNPKLLAFKLDELLSFLSGYEKYEKFWSDFLFGDFLSIRGFRAKLGVDFLFWPGADLKYDFRLGGRVWSVASRSEIRLQISDGAKRLTDPIVRSLIRIHSRTVTYRKLSTAQQSPTICQVSGYLRPRPF